MWQQDWWSSPSWPLEQTLHGAKLSLAREPYVLSQSIRASIDAKDAKKYFGRQPSSRREKACVLVCVRLSARWRG